MSSQLNESLSAVVDGEATRFETRRVLDEATRDPSLAQRWARYHLIGAAMRREGEAVSTGAALERFWATVDTDTFGDDSAGVASTHSRRRIGQLTSVVVAAVVALAVVIGFGPTTVELPSQDVALETPVLAPSRILAQRAQVVATEPSQTSPLQLASESDVLRNRAYMLHHAHHVALNQASMGGLPFARVAAFESR